MGRCQVTAIMFGSFVLASTFIVSHNIEGAKPAQQASGSGYQVTIAGKVVDAQSDWGMWQVVTSASWGGAVGSFFSGGLNLQARPAQPKTNPSLRPPALDAIGPCLVKLLYRDTKRSCKSSPGRTAGGMGGRPCSCCTASCDQRHTTSDHQQ